MRPMWELLVLLLCVGILPKQNNPPLTVLLNAFISYHE